MPKPIAHALEGWTVFSIRMANDHATLRAAARKQSASVIAVSPMRYQALNIKIDAQTLAQATALIFTSPAAIGFALKSKIIQKNKSKNCFVIGEGSAQMLKRAGFKNIVTAEKPNASSLLKHSALLAQSIASVIVFTAPNGRTDWKTLLAKRNIRAQEMHVYARKPMSLSARVKNELLSKHKKTARLVSSQTLVHELWQQTDPKQRQSMIKGLWVCSSDAVEQSLRERGVSQIINAQSPRPQHLLQALAVAVHTKRLP